MQLARIATDDGSTGFGPCRPFSEAEAIPFLGARLEDLIDSERGAAGSAGKLEFPLWDLLGQREGRPVYRLLEEVAGKTAPESLRVRCYDTSLYIDDLHLATDEAGASLIAAEASYGYEHGHRSFKIKVGRGARHMPLLEGNRRDVAVIRAVRDAVGVEATILIDANNGYNLNIAKQILGETADCNVFWLEEAFHEDGALYEDLHAWIEIEALDVNIADGEGLASPMLLDYARDGLRRYHSVRHFQPRHDKLVADRRAAGRLERTHGAASLRAPRGQLRFGPPGGSGRRLPVCRVGRGNDAGA